MLQRMVSAIRHRGPDGSGFHIEPGLGLGHARLSIIDLAGGAQPVHNEDQSIWISYNGEVFNYVELRRMLEQRGHRFYTNTDTEVIVHLYEERGDDFVQELNGQFAFALWDRPRRRLLLVRDRTGILPLYYTRTREGVLFASEVKALLASGRVQAALDPNGLDETFTFWAPLAPRTMFKGIAQVCPGEMVVLQGERLERRTYWRWEFPEAGSHRTAPEAQLEGELRDLLTDATRIRLRADVPVGAYLSGGLDSSSLVALVNRIVPDLLRTFSIGFDDAGLDETRAPAADGRQHLRTDNARIQCSLADIAASFPDTIRHAESPVLRTAPTPMRLLSGLVRRSGIKVVLTGEGADEVLGGYDIFKEAKVRQFWARNPASAWRPALLKRLYPYLDLTSAQSAAYLREFFGVGLDRPQDPFFSHLPRWMTTAQCKLFLSDDLRAPDRGHGGRALPGRTAGRHRPLASLQPRRIRRGANAAAQLPVVVAGRPDADGQFRRGTLPVPGPPADRLCQRAAPALQDAGTAREAPAAGNHAARTPCRRSSSATSSRTGPPTPPPSCRATPPDYVNQLLGRECVASYGYFDPDKVGRLVAKLQRARVHAARDNMAFVGILSTQLWHRQFVEGRADA